MTIDYMAEYATRSDETENIFEEFRVSKGTQAKADELHGELCRDRNQLNQFVA